jgi:transglutaminase-like putative cysteine protease
MTAAAWLMAGTTVLVVAAVAMARLRLGPVRWAGDALARRREAEARAEALLLRWLSPHQREQYRSHGWFEVVTPGGNRYRIRPTKVIRLDARRSAYCIEATPWVPVADQMLAKKLLLETDERRFLATAHRYR